MLIVGILARSWLVVSKTSRDTIKDVVFSKAGMLLMEANDTQEKNIEFKNEKGVILLNIFLIDGPFNFVIIRVKKVSDLSTKKVELMENLLSKSFESVLPRLTIKLKKYDKNH
jgi:hypothetical protein